MFYKKIFSKRVIARILVERFSEPLHLNLMSVFIAIFGSTRQKIFFDLINRQHNAFSILSCAEQSKSLGLKGVSVLEFGVAAGAGFLNMANIAKKVTKLTGVDIKVYGFDTGEGLPEPEGFKDYSNTEQKGNYPMNIEKLKKKAPKNAELVLGNVKNTVHNFIKNLSTDYPIGYIVQDMDYYSSTKDSLELLKDENPEKYLPIIHLYLDDIDMIENSVFCGEELACTEFNEQSNLRKIERNVFLRSSRLFKNAKWLQKMHKIHIFDHSIYKNSEVKMPIRVLTNPYL